MKHPIPLLGLLLISLIVGGTMWRNTVCPCGVPVAASVVASAPVIPSIPEPAPELMPKAELGEVPATTPTVDEARIPTIEQKLKARAIILYFDFDQTAASLSDEQKQTLDEVRYYLSQMPAQSIHIEGHTDSRGKKAYNRALSQERSDFIAQYLTNGNLVGSQITTIAKGETSPAASNKTAKGRAQNRRVVIFIPH